MFVLTKDNPYLALRASYGVAVVSILDKIDRVITALQVA